MYQIEVFKTLSGKEIVSKFILSLPQPEQAKVNYVLELLSEFGFQLRPPYSKKLTGYKKLFELRTTGKSPIRLIYSSINNKFYVLNAFIKKSNKTPVKEIDTALSRLNTLTYK